MTPLRQRMIEDMQVRNLAPHTRLSHVQQISRFARHFGRSPALLEPANIRAYQVHLVQNRQLSASSILVAVAALRFLYKVSLKRGWSIDEVVPTCRKPQRLPVALSRDEVSRFLTAVELRKHRIILTVCYAAGLRISEAVRLTAAAIDGQRMILRVAAGKGGKDRYVMLSPKLLGESPDTGTRDDAGLWRFVPDPAPRAADAAVQVGPPCPAVPVRARADLRPLPPTLPLHGDQQLLGGPD